MARTEGAEKRVRLVNAAAMLFWTNGYAATSLADIAKEAHVPLGNIYYYFKTKAEIARAVADLFVADMIGELQAIDQTYDTPKDRLSAVLELLARGTEMRTRAGCPIAGAIRDFSKLASGVAKRAAESLSILENWIAETLAQDGQAPDEARATAEEILALWQGAVVAANAFEDPGRLRRAITVMARRLDCAVA